MRRRRRRLTAARAGLLAFCAARMDLMLCVVPALLVLAVWLCFVVAPTP
ncbi:hypothetical protein [Streptomyces javensis]|uniref:Uncharacterized protein n=1 Tax=Streptomyces javensis TaxID=114698 RepID=A0ABS0RDX1_9ACTN|nr:hypothetical protein [Streptomyces javensis]MBI0315031.1 hypothetical protein [Streptomyces javensis]